MSDYLYSRSLEVQQRALEYKFFAGSAVGLANGGRDLLFCTPLTETQVTQENLDFNLSFLDGLV